MRTSSKVKSRILPSQLSMIADDLAGACDTGVEFLDSVGSVTVVIDSDIPHIGAEQPEGLTVWNTESRSLSAKEAYDKVRRVCRVGRFDQKKIILKKIDSAFRGQFGPEVTAVIDELPLALCCLVPAIPDFGRVTRDGIQYIDGVPIAETFYKNDPKQPVTESNVTRIAAQGTQRQVGLLDLHCLRSAESRKHLNRLIASGAHIIVADGESHQDLEKAVENVLGLSGRLMFVGGQGVGHALAKFCHSVAEAETKVGFPEGGILVVCGTLHPRAREQFQRSYHTHGIDPVYIHFNGQDDHAAVELEAETVASRLKAHFQNSQVGFLASSEQSLDDPLQVEKAVALAIRKIYERTRLAGLILTGGTTAYNVCRQLGIKCLQLRQRISWGVTLTQAPDLSGLAIGVKGGSLGAVDAINQIIGTVRSST